MSTSDICASSNMLLHSKYIKLYAHKYHTHNFAVIMIIFVIIMTNIAIIIINLVLHLVHTKQINPHDLLFSWVSTAFADNADDDAVGAGDYHYCTGDDAGDDDAISDITVGNCHYGGVNEEKDTLVKMVLVMTQNWSFVLVLIKSLNQL